MMRKQKSPCTLPSYDNLSNWQVSPMGSCSYENQLYQSSPLPQFVTFEADQMVSPYQDVLLFDYNGAGDLPPQNFYPQYLDDSQTMSANGYLTADESWNLSESVLLPEQSVAESYILPTEDGTQSSAVESFQPPLLQYGMPTVTDHRTVALLLRHLIRVDMSLDGSVCVYNFPAMSIITLSAAGNKCYVKHPNGRVFQEGSVIHMMTGNERQVKISRRGITFSSVLQSLAYFVDESGTKTTTAKFADLHQDLTAEVFYDGNWQNNVDVEDDCYKMVSKATYQNYPDGSELWVIGGIRIKQDRWGEVTVVHNNGRRTIATSPTIRRVNVESPSVSINIDCYSKNYFTVKKDLCVVTSGYCGLVVQNRSQKAGLDRNGKLVLF